MSIHLRLVTKDGVKIGRRAVCFGILNQFPWSGNSITENLTPNSNAARRLLDNTVTQRGGVIQQAFTSYIEYIPGPQFNPQYWSATNPDVKMYEPENNQIPGETGDEYQERCLSNYFKEMQVLLDDLPVFKDMVTVHPFEKVVRVHVKNFPADKVMLALFLFRNMAQYDYTRGYTKLRDKGYRPRVAAIFSQITSLFGGNSMREGSWSFVGEGEASFVRTYTFGKLAATQWINQTFPEDLYHQEPITEQLGGYKRDDHFSSDGVTFNTRFRSSNGDWRFLDDDDAPYYRHMSDTFCVIEDTPLDLPLSGSVRENSYGFNYDNISNLSEEAFLAVIDKALLDASV